MPFDINEALSALPESERAIAQQRIGMIHAAQRQQGMEPRTDSILTYKYAMGALHDDVPSSIATELVVVDTICKKTKYCEILEHVMRQIAAILKSRYQLTWTDAWIVARFYVPSMLKLHCFRQIPE